MKQSKVTVLSGVFTLCVCLAPAMPLHACEQSGDRDGKAVPSASDAVEKQAITLKSAKAEAVNQQAAVHEVTKVAKHSVGASVENGKTENKIAVQKEPSQATVSHVDYKELEERLKHTDAIGFFTKLAIRNDIVDLVDKIKQYRKKSMLKARMKEIRARFDGLLLKIIALLEEDPDLSRDLYVGREAIWESLLEVKA
ncbi:MAG: hypothetical protein Q9M12_08905 [Mariprofundus sp.]|nr:hypothetical protein [Mariprofundus sp.]